MQTSTSLQEGPQGSRGAGTEEPRAQTGLRGGQTVDASMPETSPPRPGVYSEARRISCKLLNQIRI